MNDLGQLRQRVGTGPRRLLPSRRQLLVGGGIAAGLVVGWSLWPRDLDPRHVLARGEHGFGPFIKVGNDGHVAVVVPQCETGQGQFTLFAQIVADELGADWRSVSVEPASPQAVYAMPGMIDRDAMLAMPRTGVPQAFSTIGVWRHLSLDAGQLAMLTDDSVMPGDFELPLRIAAAHARAQLCMAAAERWDADWQSCEIAGGFVLLGRRRLRLGDVAAAAADIEPPSAPPLRAPGSGALSGQSMPRLDLPAKIDGSLNFAADIRLPDMLFASVRAGPVGDTRFQGYDLDAASRVRGFVSAIKHDRWVAAVATNSWAAQRALDAMAPRFETVGQRADSAVIDRRLKQAVERMDGTRLVDRGSVSDAFSGRPVLSADYVIAPALHAPLETRTATAAVDDGGVQLWVASDAPGACRAAVAAALGLPLSDVTMFVMPGGGSFGAAMDHEPAVQAALIARETGRAVQLCWTRTEEILRSPPRAPVRARMLASLSSGASVDAWHSAFAVQAARHEWRGRLSGEKAFDAMRDAAGEADAAAIEGAEPPYVIPHLAIDHLPVDTGLPAGRWRARAAGYTHFVNEAFVDELARAAGSDPFSFRMTMLGNEPRLAACLQGVTTAGGWTGGEAGSGTGLACGLIDGSFIALMVRARPTADGIAVNHIHAMVDCGRITNPTLARQQIESGIVLGLSLAVGATTRYRRGLAQARRWRDLGLPHLAQVPAITVDFMPSSADPGGTGAIGLVAVAPAIANALYTVTGTRIRRLPLSTKPIP